MEIVENLYDEGPSWPRQITLAVADHLCNCASRRSGKVLNSWGSPLFPDRHLTMSFVAKVNGTSPTVQQRTSNLLKWTSSLTFKHLPGPVVERTKSFFLDTLACSVAGHTHPAVQSLLSFSNRMGPKDGPCELFFSPEKRTSAAFAALVNGASSHVVELDDLNNAGMIHPVIEVLMTLTIGYGCISCRSCSRTRC
jgi:hypothetical protein